MLNSNFEEIKMLENEIFTEFYAIFNDTMNFRLNLGEKLED